MKARQMNGLFGYDGQRRFVIGYAAAGEDTAGFPLITEWFETTDQPYAEEIGRKMRASGDFTKVRVVSKAKAVRLGKIDDEIRRRMEWRQMELIDSYDCSDAYSFRTIFTIQHGDQTVDVMVKRDRMPIRQVLWYVMDGQAAENEDLYIGFVRHALACRKGVDDVRLHRI